MTSVGAVSDQTIHLTRPIENLFFSFVRLVVPLRFVIHSIRMSHILIEWGHVTGERINYAQSPIFWPKIYRESCLASIIAYGMSYAKVSLKLCSFNYITCWKQNCDRFRGCGFLKASAVNINSNRSAITARESQRSRQCSEWSAFVGCRRRCYYAFWQSG